MPEVVLRVRLEIRGRQAVMAHREVREVQAHQEYRAHQAHPHHLWARRVEKARKAARVAWVSAEMRGQPVSAEIAEIRGLWGILFRAHPGLRGRRAVFIMRVNRDPLGHRGQTVHRDLQGHPGHPARLAQLRLRVA